MSKRKKKAVRKTTPGEPVFVYTSQCCHEPANKKACAIDGSVEFSDRNKPEHSLGTWNCTRCRKKCKVTRAKARVEELPPVHSNTELLQELGVA